MSVYKEFAQHLSKTNSEYCMETPSMVKTHEFVDNLIHLLFPIKLNCGIDEVSIELELERCAVMLKEYCWCFLSKVGPVILRFCGG